MIRVYCRCQFQGYVSENMIFNKLTSQIPLFRVILHENSISGIILVNWSDPLGLKVNFKVKYNFNIHVTLFWCDCDCII